MKEGSTGFRVKEMIPLQVGQRKEFNYLCLAATARCMGKAKDPGKSMGKRREATTAATPVSTNDFLS